MKHFLSLLLVLLSFQAFGKKDIRTDNLYYTCKVWGFLKYHHPNISARDMDWDKELKEMLIKMDKVGSAAKRNRLLKSWTDNLGTLDTLSSQPLQNKYIEILPDKVYDDYTRIRDSEALIIDLRRYPKDLGLVYLICEGNPYKGIKFLAPLQGTPGSFHSEPTPVQTMDFTNPEHYKGKIILLVNNLTQSSGETAAMLLQTYGNATIIGTQTAGANGNVTYLPLPGYIRARFSSIGIAYPSGELMQKRGVKIDQTIKPTLEGIRQGKDELLEYAVMMLR